MSDCAAVTTPILRYAVSHMEKTRKEKGARNPKHWPLKLTPILLYGTLEDAKYFEGSCQKV